VLLLGLVAALVAVGVSPGDADRPLRIAQRDLQRGRRAELVGEAGPPRWWRPSAHGDSLKGFLGPDATFAVEARRLALVELLPDPMVERYRFRAEVRHDDWYRDANGEVGIYFLHRAIEPRAGERVHYFCALGFNDMVSFNDPLRLRFPNLPDPGNPVYLTARRCKEPEDTPAAPRIYCLPDFAFAPSAGPKKPARWRRISVVVTPAQIEAWWEDRCVGVLPRNELVNRHAKDLGAGRNDPIAPSAAFAP